MNIVKRAFVAYPSRDAALADMIAQAVSRANAKQTLIRFEPWIFNDVVGLPLTQPILDGIENSAFVVADITYLNRNVVYESGYAIGSRKRMFLIRNSNIPGDKNIAQHVGVFDTLGYAEYANADELAHRLNSYIAEEPLPFSMELDRIAPVYVVEQSAKDDASTTMLSRLKKARYRYRSFNPSEDPRLSATDAIRKVAESAGTMLSILSEEDQAGIIHNIRSLFVAGLSHGMAKPTLILCPKGVVAPLDIRDEVKIFQRAEDIQEYINNFALEITDYLQQSTPVEVDTATFLQSLHLGDPTAENEMTTLGGYYLTTDQFTRTLRGDVNLVLGRKGSGKTALFIQVREKIRADKRNIVVDLKPEGYQLLKLKEDILTFLSEGSRQHLVTAFWEYLLLLEVTYKILEKDKQTYKHNHHIRDIYAELDREYKTSNISMEGDFSERLTALSQRITEDYRALFAQEAGTKLTSNDVTALLYKHDLLKIKNLLSKYLEHKESVWILFDNLDKGWSTSGVDAIDAIVLRCLIDAGRKIERDFRKAQHTSHCIIFIRNDVYEHLMDNSADYGKEMRAVLDWDDGDLLREMLRLRIVSQLSGPEKNVQFFDVWPKVCVSHFKGEESSAYIFERAFMRPRNVLKILSHARGFANNFRHEKISEADLEKGVRAYSNDVLVELDRELSDVFPLAKNLLYHFLDSNAALDKHRLASLIIETGISEQDVPKIIDFLLYYGVLGLMIDGEAQFIYDVKYDLKILKIRADRAGEHAIFVLNKAFWAALSVH
jgi:hypothetical protein